MKPKKERPSRVRRPPVRLQEEQAEEAQLAMALKQIRYPKLGRKKRGHTSPESPPSAKRGRTLTLRGKASQDCKISASDSYSKSFRQGTKRRSGSSKQRHRQRQAERLRALCEDGDAAGFRKFVERVGPSEAAILARRKDQEGWTPLHFAAYSGSYGIAVDLIKDLHVDLSARTNSNSTALLLAVSRNNLLLTKLLVNEMGPELRLQKEELLGAAKSYDQLYDFIYHEIRLLDLDVEYLHTAVKQGHVPMIKCLLENRGVDVNGTNADGETALFVAVRANHLPVARFLVEDAKANLLVRNYLGRTAREEAVSRARLQMREYLLTQELRQGLLTKQDEKEARKAISKEMLSHFHSLCRVSNLSGIISLLKWIPLSKEELKKSSGIPSRTAIHHASEKGNLDILMYLTKTYDFNTNLPDSAGDTPLILAVRRGQVSTARYLVEVGGRECLSVKTSRGLTPRALAETTGNRMMARFLLQEEVASRLVSATEAGKVAKGIDTIHLELSLRNAATDADVDRVISLFDGTVDLASYEYGRSRSKRHERHILKPRVNSRCEKGYSALHCAVYSEADDVVRVLLEQKADVNAQANNGETPLMTAAEGDMYEITKMLLDSGEVRLDARSAGQTARDLAPLGMTRVILYKAEEQAGKLTVEQKHEYRLTMEQCIRMYAGLSLHPSLTDVLRISESCEDSVKPDINSKGTDHHGRTALHLASINNHGRMIKRLIESGANIEERDDDNHTPLMLSAMNASLSAASNLVSAGANLFAKTRGMTARAIAGSHGNLRVEKYLLWAERRARMLTTLDRDAPILHNHYKAILELAGFDKSVYEQIHDNGYGHEDSMSESSEPSEWYDDEYDTFFGNFLHLAAFLNPPHYDLDED
mmetsp:Transcript_4102/g.8187  ORF Transcript_4102/g.8187 Transcript_4102/m.8187 type:complete len:877 (-) Transcript_4102:180-2810(-)